MSQEIQKEDQVWGNDEVLSLGALSLKCLYHIQVEMSRGQLKVTRGQITNIH